MKISDIACIVAIIVISVLVSIGIKNNVCREYNYDAEGHPQIVYDGWDNRYILIATKYTIAKNQDYDLIYKGAYYIKED